MATRYVWKKYNVSTKQEYYVSAWTTAFTNYQITSYYNTISLAAEYTINQSTGALELVSPTEISDKSVLLNSWESKPYMTSTNSNLKRGQVMHITNYKQTTGMYGVKNCYLWADVPTVSSRNVEICGSEIGSVQTASSSSYPTNGKHSDGYWYIYQGTVEVNTNPTVPGTPVLPEEIIAGENCSVSWTAATDAESAVSYKLEVSVDGGAWTQIYDGANRSYSYHVSSGTSTIAFRVKAYDDGGLESDYATSATAIVLTRTPIGDVPVGQSVFMNVNGVRTEFLVVHQGLPGTMYDSSCDGTWLLMKDIYVNKAWDSSNNDYANSDIHSYLNNTFVNLFDRDIKSVIKQVKIPYTAGSGSSTTVTSGSGGLSAKVFLLSYVELGYSSSTNAEGTVVSYFNGADNSKRIAKINGSTASWWLRSPRINYADYARFVQSTGSSNVALVTGLYGVRPALVLPFAVSIDSEYNVIASESGTDEPSEPEETTGSSALIWGSYNKFSDILVNVNGAWKNYSAGYANVNGVWKELISAKGLPIGYTKLEYIESSGTQYINTGFNPNQDTRVIMDAQLNDYTDVSPLSAYFGAADGSTYFRLMDPSTGNNNLVVYYNTVYSNRWDVPIGIRRIIDMNGSVTTIDNVTKSYSEGTFQLAVPLFLFASSTKTGSANYLSKGKLYSCQIYDAGVLIRDFVPCLNESGVAGLWDKVNGVFYGNAGTGSFITN